MDEKAINLRTLYMQKEYEKDGQKASYPCMQVTVLKFDLHGEIQRLAQAGFSDTEILNAIESGNYETAYVSSGGKVSFDAPYGKMPLSEAEAEQIKSLKPKTERKRGSVLTVEEKTPKSGETYAAYRFRMAAMSRGAMTEEECKTLFTLWNEINA